MKQTMNDLIRVSVDQDVIERGKKFLSTEDIGVCDFPCSRCATGQACGDQVACGLITGQRFAEDTKHPIYGKMDALALGCNVYKLLMMR